MSDTKISEAAKATLLGLGYTWNGFRWEASQQPAELAEQRPGALDVSQVALFVSTLRQDLDDGMLSLNRSALKGILLRLESAMDAIIPEDAYEAAVGMFPGSPAQRHAFMAGVAHALAATGKQKVVDVQGDARAQFEAWAKKSEELYDLARYEEDPDRYLSGPTRKAWEAWQAALAARQPGSQVPVAGPYLDEPDAPSNPLWKRLRSIANWLTVLAPNSHMEAAELLLTASARIQSNDAAPPAQGIDLGKQQELLGAAQILRVISMLKDREDMPHWPDGWDWERIDSAIEKAQGFTNTVAKPALIDQRDAAPGVGNG